MSAGKVRTALSPSGALVRSALLSVSDGVVVLRPSGRIIDIDAHLRRRLGIAAAALSKRTLWSLVEPPHRSPLSAAWRTSKGGLAAFDAVPFSLPRGAVMTADLRFTRDDASGAVLCALHDVSRHRHAVSSLTQQNREYEELLTRVPFALYKFRRTAQGEDRLEYLSPRVAEMFGIDTAPLLSDVDRVVDLVHEEDRAAFAQWITDPRWHDEDTSIEVRYGTPGGVRWIRLDASPHHMENGDIVWDGIAQDITERRVAEERLHQQTVESRFLADASAQLAGCVTEAAVYSVISSMFTTYVPGSLVFVLKTLENGSRSRLVEIGGIRLEVLEAGKRLLRFDPVGRTFENREGFYEKYCRPTLQEMSGGLYEASSGVVPKSIARRIERLLGVSHVYTAGIAEGTSYVGYIDLMTPAALPLQRSTVESFLHQCYLALSAIAGRERANDEEVRRRFHFENVIDGIVVLDEDRRVVEANRRFADLLGYTAEEILTKHAWDWDVLFPTREAFERQWPSLPPTSGIIETQHRRRDGGIIDIEVVWNPVVWNGRRCLYCLCRDITERRVASERLQQELQRRRIVMDTTADGICVFDRDHRVIDCNRRMCELLGYDRDALLQLYAWDIDAVETRERIQSMFADAASQNRTFETRQRRRDGSVYDAEISIRRTSIGGEPVVVTGTRDITERKRLDRALKESQDRFQRYVEHAHVIITIIDSAGRVEYINRTESGVPVEGFIGRNIFDVILPDHVGEVRRRIREARESGGAQSYITSAMVEGRQAWYQNRVAPFGDDDRFLITSLNITDLKAAEESLRRSEERFRNLVNRIPQRVFVKDVDSVYVSGNEAFASDLGVPPSEIAGRTDLDFFPAPLAEQYRSDDRRVIGRAAPLDREEEYILRGERRTILTTKVPMFNPDGTVSGVLGIFTDITERKAMERNVAESELRYRTLFETMAQGVVYQNAAGSVSSANPAALRILGLSLEQILGRTSMDPRWHAVRENGDPFPGEEHPAMAALRTGRPVPDTVMGVFRPDLNAYVWIVINAVPLFGPDGRTPVEVFSTLEDVTTRKRFETELRNSEERYRTVAQYTYDWEMWIGNDGTIRYISPSCERITGYTAEEITRNPSRLVSMIHPDDRDDYRRHVEDEFRDASVHAFEMRIITRSGAERWVQHLCRPIVTQDGRNLGRRISNRDITERKMDERRLQESEERYRGIVENIHQAYYEADGRAVFTYCNPGLLILSGYGADELYSMSSFRLVCEEDRPRVMEQYRAWKKGSTRQMVSEFRVRTKDGSVFWVEQTTHMEFEPDGTFVRAFNFVKDIRERKNAEEELRRSEERNRTIVATIPDVLFVQDAEGRFLDIHMPDGEALLTPAAAFVGRTMEDLLSQEEIFGAVALRLESPDLSEAATDIASVRRFVSTVVLPKLRSAIAEQAPQLYQYSLTVNGTTAHFEARLAPFDETRVLHIVRNVTEKVAYEQTLRTMNEELEHRVLSRTAELTEANRELEAFSYSVSHDLRAPLRAIDSFSAVLSEEYAGRLDDEARRLISVIRGSIRRMDQLVNGLLTLSRIGRDELRLQRVDMNGFFRAEVDAVLPPGSQHRHSVTIAPLPDCRADETLLRQAVGNLLSNAVKYSSESPTPEIFISGTVRGRMAVYTVADNGVGFDPALGEKLFGIFQRLHTDERFKGVGVGLSIVQRVVHRLGGDITAEGRVDGGASFTFTLPLADDER